MTTFHFEIKTGGRGKALAHSDYISRRGQIKIGSNDLVFHGHGNMPGWAEHDPALFWAHADCGERINGAVYRELVVALQNELTIGENKGLVRQLIEAQIGDRPYEYAIHNPTAALGHCPQPHAHVMYSDRVPDGLSRPPEQYFKRFNSSDPSRGGCRKLSGGKERFILGQELVERRAEFARLTNAALERVGATERVDHRSNAARGIDAIPETHLGSGRIRRMKKSDPDSLPNRAGVEIKKK